MVATRTALGCQLPVAILTNELAEPALGLLALLQLLMAQLTARLQCAPVARLTRIEGSSC